MNNFLKSFSDRKFRYGAYSTLSILIVLAILVAVNLVMGQLNITYDLTKDKTYSISDDSKDILKKVNQDVTVYALFKTGQESLMFTQLLEEYQNTSSRINVVYKDPYLYPKFVDAYAAEGESIPVNSVIVESGSRFKVINAADMVTTEFDYQTFQENIKSIDIEPQLTNAINYVTSDNTPIIYTVTGNNEMKLPDSLKKQISLTNFEVKEFDLLVGEVPEDCSLLIITMPTRDWTKEEADKCREYLKNDGKAIFIVGYTGGEYPNLEGVLNSYGVQLGNYLVVEGNPSNYLANNPQYISPNFSFPDITKSLETKKYRALLFAATGIEKMEVAKNSIKVEPIFMTSNDAYGKTNLQSETVVKEATDVDGPFMLGAFVTDYYYTDTNHYTKLIVYSSQFALDESINQAMGGSNFEYFVNSVNYLMGSQDRVFILPKAPPTTQSLQMTQAQALMVAGFSAIGLPVIIIAVGFYVWLRRRNS